MTGRNHHSGSIGIVNELATSDPVYTSSRPPSVAPPAKTLKLNGYNTVAFGKWHEPRCGRPARRVRSLNGEEFEHLFGFLSGETE